MDLRPELQIKTATKAMVDVILPAIDINNKLALEQAGLVIAMLNILVTRMPLSYRYARDELERFVVLAKALRNQANQFPEMLDVLHSVEESIRTGEDVLERARAEPIELESANFDLRDRIGNLVTVAYINTPADQLKDISELVNDHAKGQLLRERAWVIDQGWEPDPSAVPSIETLISKVPENNLG